MNNPNPKIHAYLAQCGLGSRREIERWIQEKKITVNGAICQIGQRVSAKDKIVVKGKRVEAEQLTPDSPQVLIYHKKVGEICTRGESECPSVFNALPRVTGRWVSIGRLDVNTSGLLLFTNDGQLAHQLMHPKFEMLRKYQVRVFGRVTQAMLAEFKKGIMLDGDLLKFEEIKPFHPLSEEVTNQWFEVSLRQGKNREIRRLFESKGCQISRLIRSQYANITLPRRLLAGRYQFMTESEVQALQALVADKSST